MNIRMNVLPFAHTIPSFSEHVHCTVPCTFDLMKNLSPSDYHSYQMAHQTRLRKKKGAPAYESKRKKTKQVKRNKVQKHQNGNHSLVTKRLAAGASIRQCHAYNYVCTVRGSLGDAEKHLLLCLKNFIYIKKRDDVARFTQPKQCFLVPVSLWRTAPLVHRILFSECLIQLASQ